MEAFFYLLPVLIGAFLIRWIRILSKNSSTIVEQNKQILEELKKKENS